jgi:hypothetical protein
MKYTIFEHNFSVLTKKLTNLNQKLTRIGASPVAFSVTGQHDVPANDNPTKLLRTFDIEVSCANPSHNGWKFIATIVHTDEGNIVRAVPGFEVSAEHRDRPTWCDHCKTNRQRHDTYIVRHDDGRTMQVGSSCLGEFIGSANPNTLCKAAEHMLNAFDVCDAAQSRNWLGGEGAGVYRIDLDTFLANVAATVLAQGQYVTRKSAYEQHTTATSDIARNSRYEVTPEAIKLATDARNWVLNTYSPAITDVDGLSDGAIIDMITDSFKSSNRQLSDFEHNLLAAARAEAIEPRLCGIAAYIVEAYRRAQPKTKPTQLDAVGLERIFQMFDKAKSNKLAHPGIRLVDDAGQHLKLSLAADSSKNAGYVYVKGTEYFGKISPKGEFFPVKACPSTVHGQLAAFAADPETIAAKYGKMTGCCCFCSRKLDDARSTEVGYGPVCAKKFGLNWGKQLEEVLAA